MTEFMNTLLTSKTIFVLKKETQII